MGVKKKGLKIGERTANEVMFLAPNESKPYKIP